MAEIWDLYDKSGKKTGETHMRGKPIPKGKYHLVAEIWTINSTGSILITKRHPNKPNFPLLWECTGGSVVAGETAFDGAKRELEEETGIKAAENELEYIGCVTGNSAIHENFLLKRDIEISELKLQADEVIDARWITEAEFYEMCNKKLVVPTIEERYNTLVKPILKKKGNSI